MLTVESLRQDARGRRFPGASRARKEVGVGDSVVFYCTLEGAYDVILASKFRESGGSETAIERRDALDGGGGCFRVRHAPMLTAGRTMPKSKAVARRSVAPSTVR